MKEEVEGIYGMMWSNLFKKDITLNCYTWSKNVYEHFKIDHSKSFIPEWFKRLPGALNHKFYDTPTMKSCPGIINLYKKGVMIPLWSDLVIKSDVDSYQYQFADGHSQISYNHPDAMGSFADTTGVHSLNITSPWVFDCDSKVEWMFINPIWNTQTMDVTVVPGSVDFNLPMRSNINIMIRKGLQHNITIEAGSPIAQMIPLTERNIKIKCHRVSQEEFVERQDDMRLFFFGGHRKMVKLKEKQQKKCPFNH